MAPISTPPSSNARVSGNVVHTNRLVTSDGMLGRWEVVGAVAMSLPLRNQDKPQRHRGTEKTQRTTEQDLPFCISSLCILCVSVPLWFFFSCSLSRCCLHPCPCCRQLRVAAFQVE